MASKTTVANDRGSQEYTKLLRQEVDEVIDVMSHNVEQTQKRGTILNVQEENIVEMKERAQKFQELALENKKKYMWENYKMIVIGGIIIGVICIIALISIFNTTEE